MEINTIQKGRISSIEGNTDRNGDKITARVIPSTSAGIVTRPLTIPWWLRGKMGTLTPGDEVAFVVFEDGTGILLSRLDGEWNGTVTGDITVEQGSINILSGDVTASGISCSNHRHMGVNGETSSPH